MENYIHNGKTVKYDVIIDKTFLSILSKKKIRPTELPDSNFNYRVFSYVENGIHQYAAVVVSNAHDAYIEKVYMTDSIPEDGFWNMISDVLGQISGEKPRPIESRLHMVGRRARENAIKFIDNKYPDHLCEWMLYGYPSEIEDEIAENEKMYYNQCGYDLDMLIQLDVQDVDFEYIKKILR